jgi:outer membrane protein TolC
LRPLRSLARTLSLAGLLIAAACAGFVAETEREESTRIFEQDLQERTARILHKTRGQLQLSTCIELALENNLELLVAELQVELGSAEARAALADLLPDFNADVDYSRRSNEAYSRSEYLIGGGGIRDAFARSQDKEGLRFFARMLISPLDFGIALLSHRQAGFQTDIEEQQRLRTAQRIRADVEREFASCLALESALPLLETAVTEARRVHAQLAALFEEKRVGPLRLHRAAEDLEQVELLHSKARHGLEQARIRLAQAIGVSPDAHFEVLPGADKESILLELPELSALFDLALRSRPELWAADLGVAQQRAQVTKSWLAMLPNARLSQTYNYDSNHFLLYDQYWTAGAGAYVDIFDSLFGILDVQAAEAAVRRSDADRRRLAHGILSQVALAHLRCIQVQDELAILRRSSQRAARLTERLRKRQEAGQATMLDLRSARREQLEREALSLEAQARASAAWADLRAAVGAPITASTAASSTGS